MHNNFELHKVLVHTTFTKNEMELDISYNKTLHGSCRTIYHNKRKC